MNKLKIKNNERLIFAHKIDISQPGGVSLIEMMMVISLMSIIFTVGATTLAFLMRVEMKGTARIEETLTLQQLSHQFREDAGAAKNAELISQNDKNSSTLNLDMEPGISIVYSADPHGNYILRVKKRVNNIVTRNEYRIPENMLRFEIHKKNQRQTVSMKFKILSEEMHENQTIIKPERFINIVSLVNRKFSVQDRILNINKN